jgi:hypothetical protein
MSSTPLTRAQVYAIRDRAAEGHSAPRIREELGLRVSLETVRRVIRRDSHAEIGVGASERAFVSNRLSGESRRTGEPVAPYERPQGEASEVAASLAIAREVARAMRQAPPDPFDPTSAPEASEGPSAEDILARHASAPTIAPLESADELLAQMSQGKAA